MGYGYMNPISARSRYAPYGQVYAQPAYGHQASGGLSAPMHPIQNNSHHAGGGFFSKLGALGKGLLDVPGKIVESLLHPKTLLIGAGVIALSFTPLAPVVIPAAIGFGLFQGGKTLFKGGAQVAKGWASNDLEQIRDGSGNAGAGAVAIGAAAFGARAHIRSQVGANASSVGAQNGQVAIGNRTVSAADIGYRDSIRLLGRQYRYGGRQAINTIRTEILDARTTPGGLGAYAGNVQGRIANAFSKGGSIHGGADQTKASLQSLLDDGPVGLSSESQPGLHRQAERIRNAGNAFNRQYPGVLPGAAALYTLNGQSQAGGEDAHAPQPESGH